MCPYSAIATLARKMPKTVLEVGARTGRVAEDFARAGCVVTAIDPDPRIVPGRGFPERIAVVKTTLEAFDPTAPFDLVVSSAVSHLVEYSTKEYLLRLKTLIVPDGLIYVSLLGDEDEWSHKPRAKTLSFDQALQIIDGIGLTVLYKSITWNHGTTYDGTPKYWHYYRFVLTAPEI